MTSRRQRLLLVFSVYHAAHIASRVLRCAVFHLTPLSVSFLNHHFTSRTLYGFIDTADQFTLAAACPCG